MSTSKKTMSNQPVAKDVNPITEQFTSVLNTLSSFKSQISMLAAQVKSLEKTVKKQMKQLEREAQKNKNKGNRKASGFAVPSKISNDLCEFMGKPEGTEMARTEVTKYIIQYIKNNNLPDKDNKKIIKPNNALKSLLNVKPTDEVTYFNLQKYMNRHFIKA
jgi:chromatin remodeling complex protein RSC6|tara:strand:+ start:37 stop:519 length:483 start_codon:yes stop_codon:yes gene_type:complete